jgi:hypothetical protein
MYLGSLMEVAPSDELYAKKLPPLHQGPALRHPRRRSRRGTDEEEDPPSG